MSICGSPVYYIWVNGGLYIIYEFIWVSSILPMSIYGSSLYYLWVYMGLLYIIYEFICVSSILSKSLYGSPLYYKWVYIWISFILSLTMYGPELPIIICSLVSIYNIFGLIFLYHIIWVYMGIIYNIYECMWVSCILYMSKWGSLYYLWVYVVSSILPMSIYGSSLYYLWVYMGLLYIIYEFICVSSILSKSLYGSPLYYKWVYIWISFILSLTMSIYGSSLYYLWV